MANRNYDDAIQIEPPRGRKGLFAKNILNREGTIIGYVSGKYIYDLDLRLWGTLPTGKMKSQATYIASASGRSALGYIDVNGNLFDSANRFIGTIQTRRKTFWILPVLLLMLAFICVSAYYSPYLLKSVGIGVFNPEYPQIEVIQKSDEKYWTQVERMDMLNSELGKQVIFPGATNKYYFVLANINEDDLKFRLDITEENPGMITMRYRVTMDGYYIIGGENKWATIDELHVGDLDILGSSKTLFCIEWLWDAHVSNYNDTEVGNNNSFSSFGAEAYIVDVAITSCINNLS